MLTEKEIKSGRLLIRIVIYNSFLVNEAFGKFCLLLMTHEAPYMDFLCSDYLLIHILLFYKLRLYLNHLLTLEVP